LVLTQKGYRNRLIVLVSIWIILLIISAGFLSFMLFSFNQNPQVQTESNTTWAGYIAATDFAIPTADFIGVNASWIVPTVNSSVTGYSSAWVGIGGKFDKTLIQVGTLQESSIDRFGERIKYSAWYELIPQNSIGIDSVPVTPGDKVTASVFLVNATLNEWNIKFTNDKTGQEFSKNVFYNSTRLSAEWILERPFINGHLSTLGDFGTVTFNDCYAKTNQKLGPLGSFQYSQVRMTDAFDKELVHVYQVTSKTSFAVTYLPPK
jgi:hypothetical protein